jgi:hypothetical protein
MGRRTAASTERIVTGVRALDRKLASLERKLANKVARAGLTKGARLAAKTIKKEIPSRLKSVRAAIGHSVKKAKKGPTAGITTAKAGAAVGKKRGAVSKAKRSTKHGVGIGPPNVHWWIMGTKERRKKTTGASTGRMPANPIIKRLNLRPILNAVLEGSSAALKREIAKLKLKG